MSSITEIKTDVIILGASSSSYTAANNLAINNISVTLVKFQELDENENKSILFPVGIKNLSDLSIPYQEISFKTKKLFSAYIERILNIEKYYFQDSLTDKINTYSFYRRVPVGLVNSNRFLEFLRKLASEKDIKIINSSKSNFMDLEIKESNNDIIFTDSSSKVIANYLIIGGSIPLLIREKLGIKPTNSNRATWYFKISSMLTDSLDYYFNKIKCPGGYIGIYPARNYSFIACHSNLSLAHVESVIEKLLEINYSVKDDNIELIQKIDHNFAGIQQPQISGGYLIGHYLGIRTPFLLNSLFLNLQSGLLITNNINNCINKNLPIKYTERLKKLTMWKKWTFSDLENIFFEKLSHDEIIEIAKFLNKKDLDSLRSLGLKSLLKMKLRFNKTLNLNKNEIEAFLYSILGIAQWVY
ncbi:MAG: hypothetical protein ACXAC7_13985 [Candidatus Hodarchaeales archaeon]